jgi:hypothetical protein
MPPIRELDLKKHNGTMFVGSKSASMYLDKEVYNLMYEWGYPVRIHPDDAARIKWDNLSYVYRYNMRPYSADVTRKTTWVKLVFSDYTFLPHSPSCSVWTKNVLLMLSTSKDTYQRLVKEDSERRAKKAAFVMAAHPRLGKGSPARLLDPELFQLVCRFVRDVLCCGFRH